MTAGDTAAIALGIGGFNSRQAVMAGTSAHLAALEVRDKALEIAAHLLEAAAHDLEIADGAVRVKGAPQMKVPLAEIARAVAGVGGFPLAGHLPPGLDADRACRDRRDDLRQRQRRRRGRGRYRDRPRHRPAHS